ncbi:MAG: cell wall-active antibiotics response protein [Lachnospiraceae bacterium]|nr:cell wall-active antibiotics response protein [Lachnospiraceae bacterium]
MAKTEMEYVAVRSKRGKFFRRLAKFALVYFVVDNVVSYYAEYRKKNNEKLEEENSNSAYKSYDLFMNSREIKIGDERFSGANIKNCLGGVNLDLQELKMNSDVFLNLSNIFGGISIKVPYGVNVKCDSKCRFGGVSCTVPEYEGEEVHTIYIEAKITFGGLAVNAAKRSDETVEDMFEESVLESLSKEINAVREASACRDMGNTASDGAKTDRQDTAEEK